MLLGFVDRHEPYACGWFTGAALILTNFAFKTTGRQLDESDDGEHLHGGGGDWMDERPPILRA